MADAIVPVRRMEFAPAEQVRVDFGTGAWFVAEQVRVDFGTGAWFVAEKGGRRGPHLFRLSDIMTPASSYREAAPEIQAKGLLAHFKSANPDVAKPIALRTFQRGAKVAAGAISSPQPKGIRDSRTPNLMRRCSLPAINRVTAIV